MAMSEQAEWFDDRDTQNVGVVMHYDDHFQCFVVTTKHQPTLSFHHDLSVHNALITKRTAGAITIGISITTLIQVAASKQIGYCPELLWFASKPKSVPWTMKR